MATDTSLPPGDSRFTLYHMDTAIEFLKKAGPQQWPQTYRGPHIADTQFTAHTATLLADFIDASYVNNGYVQAIFWEQLSKCDNGLARSIEKFLTCRDYPLIKDYAGEVLKFATPGKLSEIRPVLNLAKDLFVYLGIAITNPSGRVPLGHNTPVTESEILDKIVATLKKAEISDRWRKHIDVLDRDGRVCLLTGKPFKASYGEKGWLTEPLTDGGIRPEGAHIVPDAIKKLPMCFYWIAAIGGLQAAAVIAAGLNKSCNIMIIQADAHSDYDDLHWTIEADRGGEGDIINPELVDEEAEVKYYFRRLPYDRKLMKNEVTEVHKVSPGFINLVDGQEIKFGGGPKNPYKIGPGPEFCNLHLTVARIMHHVRIGPVLGDHEWERGWFY